MEDKKWLSFEKSGRVSDYLTYCRSSIGKYADYETDRNDPEYDAGGRI